MELSDLNVRTYTRRILLARMRLLCSNGFYGMLLMNVKVGLGDEHETAWIEEEKIMFNPYFLDGISDIELEYALVHLMLHLVLDHIGRRGDFKKDKFDIAADIVVNSNILRSNKGLSSSISMSNYGGVQPHLTPNGDEGWKYTVEEVYNMVNAGGVNEKNAKDDKQSFEIIGAGTMACEGENYSTCEEESEENDSEEDKDDDKEGNSDSNNMASGWDSHTENDLSDEKRKENAEKWKAAIYQACELTAKRSEAENEYNGKRKNKGGKDCGDIPLFAEILLNELKKPKIDWRTILNEFIQDEVVDYSFVPPDRRFDDSPFFLPDFNERDEKVKGLWIAVDASGSVSDDAITTAVSEIKGCIEQFNGKIEARLSFFDVKVSDPVTIESVEELLSIRPVGRGGTSFTNVFKYMNVMMADDLPDEIIVITDGYCSYPEVSMSLGIPVLWMINNEEADEPPWGKVARFDV